MTIPTAVFGKFRSFQAHGDGAGGFPMLNTFHRRNSPFDWTLWYLQNNFHFSINYLHDWHWLMSPNCIILPKSRRRTWIVLGLVSCLRYQTWSKYIYSIKDIRYAWCMHHRVCILQMNHVSRNMSTLCYLFTRENTYIEYFYCTQYVYIFIWPSKENHPYTLSVSTLVFF